MSNCTMCGINIPEGQNVCSMCYGDVDYGRDGYYRDEMERQDRSNTERQIEEQRELEQEPDLSF